MSDGRAEAHAIGVDAWLTEDQDLRGSAERQPTSNDVQSRTAVCAAYPYSRNMRADCESGMDGDLSTLAPSRAKVVSSDERWAAWVAKGVEHDRRIKARAIAIATAVGAGAFLSLIVFLLR